MFETGPTKEAKGVLKVGGVYAYLYKGPHGFSINQERMPCRVIGLTKKNVKIKAFDRVNRCWEEMTVRHDSLVDITQNELALLEALG